MREHRAYKNHSKQVGKGVNEVRCSSLSQFSNLIQETLNFIYLRIILTYLFKSFGVEK